MKATLSHGLECWTWSFSSFDCDKQSCNAESLQLKGIYLRAFEKLFNMLEDSGWELKRGDDEDGSDESDDELPPLPGM